MLDITRDLRRRITPLRRVFRKRHQKQSIFITTVVLAVFICFSSHDALAESSDSWLSASWKLVENQPEGRFIAELRLRNSGSQPLEGDWSLYFNSAAKLSGDNVSADYKLSHINGDFYALSSTPRTKPLAAGETHVIAYEGAPWAINISDAPSGFYLVRAGKDRSTAEPISVPLKIENFPDPAKLRRGSADTIPVVTAESRYLNNESLTILPTEKLTKVVPTPINLQSRSEHLTLDASFKIVCEPAVVSEAKFLADALAEVVTSKLVVEESTRITKAAPNSVRLRIDDVEIGGANKHNGDEAYVLTIDSKDGIEIVGSDPAGVLYGAQTLRALLPIESFRRPGSRIEIEATRIADAPRYSYRGLHLDVARNFQSKQAVMKLLDLMAFYKLNRLHWHLTDDEGWRLEIKQLPELTLVGGRRGHTLDEADRLIPSYGSGPFPDPERSAGSGFYTQDDVVEILRFAQARHITVIPEIDFPGHARAAIKAMEARRNRLLPNDAKAANEFLLREPDDNSVYESVQMWRDNIADVGRDATYAFLDVVVSELSDIYHRAGVPLPTIHLGGDEVPNGVWEKSAACEAIPLDKGSKIPRRSQLELRFLNRASELLAKRSIQAACWEDCLLLETEKDDSAGRSRRAARKPVPIAYVWNNVWGWGREDAAYRLANAGFDVVLCHATHLYFDLACEKDPLEPGYYWAGFVGPRAPFEFVPPDVFKNADRNSMGQPLNEESLTNRIRPTPEGVKHILGIQGQLWGENLRSSESLEYMAFPRVIALAERAWAQPPSWASIANSNIRRSKVTEDWNQFANRLGQRELPRLNYLHGGVQYRLPPPGAVVRDGKVYANIAIPGLEIRYSTDGSEPRKSSALYANPITTARGVKLKSFDARGRSSRTTEVVTEGNVTD